MILTSGFIREVRRNFPRARITLVVEPLTYPLVEFCPYVNEVLIFDRKWFSGSFVEGLEKITVFCRDNLWQKKFSVAFLPKWGGYRIPGVWLAYFSGARERIGYGMKIYHGLPNKSPVLIDDLDRLLLTKNVISPGNILSDPERVFCLLLTGGFKINQTHMELFYTAADVYRAKELLEDIPPACKKIVLGLGASEPNRKYPVEMLIVALRELCKKNLVFVIVGGKSELDAANFTEQNLPHGKVLNLVGKTTLRETEAVIAQMDYYIGNDTGVMHMAAAAKIPVLAIYRESPEMDNVLSIGEFRAFLPYQTKAVVLRPAHQLDDCATLPPVYGGCHHKEPHCITQITPQEIFAGFEQLERMTQS